MTSAGGTRLVHASSSSVDGPSARYPTIERAGALLGWAREVAVTDGPTREAAWHRERRGG